MYFYQVLDPFYRELSPVFRGGSAEFSVEYKLGFELIYSVSCLVESRVYLNLNLIINYVFSILDCPTAPSRQPEAQERF